MYAHHFGLNQDPFSIAPDPRYLFMSERHREALAHLLYGVGSNAHVAGGGFVLLTGDIGTGKTTICRCFLEQIPTGCHVAYIFNPKLTVLELLQTVCEEFHIDLPRTGPTSPTAKGYIDALNTFLLQNHASGHNSVLIIDEAQNLAPEVLEQLRLLTNLETHERKLLQIVLIGQPELRTMLAQPELEQLAQRVIARFHLDALNEAESNAYIGHRLAVAGHTGPVPLDKRALKRIHQLARGVPRRINLVCGRALLGAWANGLHRVDRAVVNKAAVEVFGSQALPPGHSHDSRLVYLMGGMVLSGVAMALFMRWSNPAKPQLPQASTTASAASPVAAASPSSQPQIPPPVPITLEAVDALLPQLTSDIGIAWRALAPVWQVSWAGGDPCQSGTGKTLQCYRASGLTLPQLRQLDRPGIVGLHADGAAPLYAVLLGLSAHSATLLIGGTQQPVKLALLVRLWHGDFATYWQPPAGYVPGLPEGSSGPAVDLLIRQLDKVEGTPAGPPSAAPQVLNAALRLRVRAFQRAQGLEPDGQPGPLTFMQLESATAALQPRLSTQPL
jgi:general secretion pathway protein A